MTDFRGGATGPAYHCWEITPHDTNPIDPLPKAVRANAAGQVTFRLKDSTADVVQDLAAGEYIFGIVEYVRATGTDAIVLHGYA